MKLIKSTDMNISDISTEVGYNSPLSFRRAFKKIHGTTPMATRTIAKNYSPSTTIKTTESNDIIVD